MTGFDEIMARASRELVDMDYLACEAHCLEGLALARSEADFTAYRRALRPLQESRRARRMLAADAAVWIGPPPPTRAAPDDRWARVIASGAGCACVVGNPESAAARLAQARGQALHAEVLLADPLPEEPDRWRVAAPPPPDHAGATEGLFATAVTAPPAEMVGVALCPDEAFGGLTPRHWFVEASEAVGDTALAWATGVAPAGTVERLAALETAVASVSDHELLHQALANAAAALEGGLGGSGVGPHKPRSRNGGAL